ncbi:hypothetical protein NM688_g4536 [Phlebia brevispora]|uniref:Uncharacterized protein n=1 Tax=Phlebia brevispora TaxID=194682 RepID=A0ACC1T2K7_9APHY|nr:hypothetical protein NM688_g4536 [Phlebia brevispora]
MFDNPQLIVKQLKSRTRFHRHHPSHLRLRSNPLNHLHVVLSPASSRTSAPSRDRAGPRRERLDAEASSSSVASSSSQSSLNGGKQADTGLPSPPSSRVTSSSSTSFLGLYPGLEEKLNEAARAHREKELATKKKQIKHRQHIYHNQFKEDVRRDRKKTREEMEKELFNLRKKQGMQSSLREFRGWLAYKERLEMLERRDALSPSPSLVDLSRAKALGPTPRRYSLPESASPAFLERALRNAQATLRSPKPPPPFSPSLDRLSLAHRRKDEEIERRLASQRVAEVHRMTLNVVEDTALTADKP